MKATNIRRIDDMRNGGTLESLEVSEKEQAEQEQFCRRQRRSRARRKLPHKITVTSSQSEQNSGANSDNSAKAGEILSGNRKR